jgi:ATP-dependent helicase HrpB
MTCFSESLPVDDALPALAAALRERMNAVLVAPPGAGKTTRVPLVLGEESWALGRRIVMLEPRRLAARAAAARMAATLGEAVGETVGLRVRLESRVSSRTRIEVVTEGVFTRMILADPCLEDVAALLFDEFHERSLQADQGLAFALDVQAALRADLRILVMSATLDGARVAGLLGPDVPVIESAGRSFPVETLYLGRDPRQRIESEVADAVLRALRSQSGSILAFLPGQGEIRRTARLLAERLTDPSIDLAPLFGAMDQREQDLAVRPAPQGRRKVVLATAIAETSLTIDGVSVVIDCGLARVPRYEPDVGVTRLETVRVSRAAADQRRGRAGRTGSGTCYRLWEEAATGALEPFGRPEILSADLAPLVIDCAAWGVADPSALSWLDPPPSAALAEARALLRELEAIDEDGRLTEEGRRLSAIALAPRLARMLVAASASGEADLAADLAAVITERGLGGEGTDLVERIERYRRDTSQRSLEMRRLVRSWLRLVGVRAPPTDLARAGAVLALAYPDRVAAARGRPGFFTMENGRGAVLEPHDPLAREPFLVVAEITGSAAAARIILAAPITLAEIEALHGVSTQTDLTFDRASASLRARTTRRYRRLILSETPAPFACDAAAAAAFADGLGGLGIERLPWTKAQRQLRERVAFLRGAEGSDWPDLCDAALAPSARQWLAPHIEGRRSLSAITADDLEAALSALLPWHLRHRLDVEAPTHFEAPTGSRTPIDYGAEGGPAVSIRVQELYGLVNHPTIAAGKVALTLCLLSPAHRPLQVTRDLPGFWRGSYAAVRSEMKGRYPRHAWPQDPLAAAPTRRAKPRGT